MTTKTPQNALEVKLPEGTRAVVINGNPPSALSLTVNKRLYTMDASGILVPANDQQTSSLEQRVLEVGQRLRDGTVVLSVDLEKNEALFVPAKIFGGKETFDNQNSVVKLVNRLGLLHHKDWRHITDDEGKTLADNWTQVTTQPPEWFWIASPYDYARGYARCGDYSEWDEIKRSNSLPVPVVRSGPARKLDI